jgi:two-component system nitrate/nitrite response regulator NarL
MDVLRLVLVDDYRMVTEALASRLSAAPDLWVAGCCQTDDPRLPEVVRWLRPDIVLIDVEPLGIAIAEVLGRIRAAWPDARIIVVSADEDVTHAVDAARAGADAWVSKSQGADQLETVLRGVARGHSWFPPEMLGEVIRSLRDDVETARQSSNLLDTLSPRELDVLTSMAKGKRARQIAAELMISADTVRTHTRSIFGKLEVHSRIEAVSVAWAAGLRPEEPGQPGEDPETGEDRPAAPRQRRPALPGQPGGARRGDQPEGGGSGAGLGRAEPGGGPAETGHPTRRGTGRGDEPGQGGPGSGGGPASGLSRLNPGPAAQAARQAGGEPGRSGTPQLNRGPAGQAGGQRAGRQAATGRPGDGRQGGGAAGGGLATGSAGGGAAGRFTADGLSPGPGQA